MLSACFNRIVDQSILPVSLSYVFNPSIFAEGQIYNTLNYILHKFRDFKEIFVDLMGKSQVYPMAEIRFKKISKRKRQLQSNKNKFQVYSQKIISHPKIVRFTQEEKIALITEIMETSCPSILFENLIDSFGSSITVEQKTDILRKNWEKSNSHLLSVLIKKGADPTGLPSMPAKQE